MNIVKVALGLASGLLIVLFLLLFMVQNTEQAMYKQMIKELMRKGKLKASEEVISAFPELVDIERKMEKAKYLSTIVNSKIQSPAPLMSENESLYVQKQMGEIRQMRKEIREDIEELAFNNSILP